MKAPRLTQKVQQMIQQAHELAERNQHASIQSIDLFMGAALVRKGTLREMHDLIEPNLDEIEGLIKSLSPEASSGIWIESFSKPPSLNTLKIWNASIDIMKRYNQTFLNEGHIIKAFYSLLSDHPELESGLKVVRKESIMQSVTSSRDLTVDLLNRDWSFKEDGQVEIRFVDIKEKDALLSWSQRHFGENWSETLRCAFQSPAPHIPILKAKMGGEMVGFAAYDVYMNKKGVFGPMGILPTARHQGVGRKLLYAALQSMKEKRYMYVVLKEAGPIEFYEQTCNAKLIPLEDWK